MGKGPPRMIEYPRLLSRFYEPLVLLCILAAVQGPHLKTHHDSSSLDLTRRRFLKNLAFLCDYAKGGKSTTSIAVEERPDCYVIWVASNEGARPELKKFLDDILAHLRELGTLPESQRFIRLAALVRRCADFARPRLQTECKFLSIAAKKCRTHIAGKSMNIENSKSLDLWLQSFENSSGDQIYTMCQNAYSSRNGQMMQKITNLGKDPDDGSNPGDMRLAFRRVRHLIGRLAAHVRAPQQLFEDGLRLQLILDDCQVHTVECPQPAIIPGPDNRTTLDGIVKRMLPNGDARVSTIQGQLALIDKHIQLKSKIVAKLERSHKGSVIHAEVQMLEHFHSQDLKFSNGDRYIACSKPSCLCCKLYFRHHPGGFVEPDTHEKIYTNWSPPNLPNGCHDDNWIPQRNLLIRMSQDFRKAALGQIARLRASMFSHPDSISGLTRSTYETSSSSESGEEWSSDADTTLAKSQTVIESSEGYPIKDKEVELQERKTSWISRSTKDEIVEVHIESDIESDTEGGASL